MKFIKKSLWAALALTLAAPAYAAMDNVDAGVQSANGSSFILNLIDTNTGKSATFDLGSGFSVFNPTNNYSWNLTNTTTGANYNSAFTDFTAGTTASDVKWAIFSGQLGPDLSSQSFYSTYTTSAISGWQSFNAMDATSVTSGFYNMIQSANEAVSHTSSVNGANFSTSTDDNYAAQYAGNLYGINGDFGLNNSMVSSYGTSMNLYKVTNSSSDDFFAPVNKTFAGAFSLTSAGVLAFAANPNYVGAVPEADTSLMMMAGLGLMGFIARRRKQTV